VKTITKREIIDAIAKEHKVPRQTAKLVVQRFLESVIESIREGNRLEFRDFGVFEPRERAAFVAQNPRTMAPVEVPARWVIKFKPGRKMQQALDEIGEPMVVTDANPEALEFIDASSSRQNRPRRAPIILDPDDTNN
jgi:nucleoid DNA-binding protein